MPEPEISPVPESPKPAAAAHYRPADDIELPPMPESPPGQGTTLGRPVETDATGKYGGLSSVLGAAALVGALVVGGWLMMRGNSAEEEHPNWRHVAAATEASHEGANYFLHVDRAGSTQTLPSIEVSARDADRSTTRQVRSALMQNDLAAATAALRAAQKIPSVDNSQGDSRGPEISPDSDLASAIAERKKEFFEIQLFDCCDEDGDVVEILVNEESFATVPITHEGMTLSVPLQPGNNTLTLRGVADGRGGITVSFRTSRGHYYCRSMRVGQEYRMAVVAN